MFQRAGGIFKRIFSLLGGLKRDLGEVEKSMFQEVT
jgi:hypothetical protein